MPTIHAKLQAIQSELKAPKGQTNKFGNYKYRSCEDILESVKPLLKEQGLTLTLSDDVVEVGGRVYVKATATIGNGEEQASVTAFARESLDKKGMDDSQITGAASSYARKYALNGLFCIDDTKDADTMDNTKAAAPKAEAPKVAPKAKPTRIEAMEAISDCVATKAVDTIWSALTKYEWSSEDMAALEECKKNRLTMIASTPI